MSECKIGGQTIDRNGLMKLKIESGLQNGAEHYAKVFNPAGDVINNEIQKLPLDPTVACDDLKAIVDAKKKLNSIAPKM